VKKSLLVVFCVIVFCGLVLPPVLQPISPTSKSTIQSTQQNPSPSTSQLTPETIPETTQGTTQPEPSQNPPEGASQDPSQSLQQPTPEPTPPSVVQSANRTLEEAVGNATSYVARTHEPYSLLMLNVMYRRFGIAEFADSLQHYDQVLIDNPDPLLVVFRRIAVYSNDVPPEYFSAVTDVFDQITVPALYSNIKTPPTNYMSQLDIAANSGGYFLTHALLATIWLQENHCELSISNDFAESLYYANAQLIGTGSVVNDLQLEAAAFLYLAGQGKRVDDAFVQRVIATQNYDGGWSASSDTPAGSYWHASVVGLMLLLHVEFPAASYPPMLATATSYESMYLNPLVVCSVAVLLFEARKVKLKAFVVKYQ